MRILIVASTHPQDEVGGAELQAYLIAKGLRELKQEVTFCAVRSQFAREIVDEDGLRYLSLPGRMISVKKCIRFFRLLKKTNPDVVYVRCIYSLWWINLLCKILKIPTIFPFYSDMHCQYLKWRHYSEWNKEKHWYKYLKKMLFQNFYVFSCRFADAILCQTKAQQRLLKKNFGIKARLIRSGHPVLEYIPLKPKEKFNIVWIGKHWKNPEVFLAIVQKLRAIPDFSFTMIGSFPVGKQKELKKLEEKIPNFIFVGVLPYQEVNKILEKSHVLINTSDYEGFSNTFIQAWMRGVPVISLKVNPDGILNEKRIGFHSQSPEQLERDLLNLYQDEKMYREYSQNCYQYARNEHNLREVSLEILGLCKFLIGIKKGKSQGKKFENELRLGDGRGVMK